jgi:DNA-binding transcriptional LysR family regulator
VKVQLADVRIFIAVASAGGLSAAARQLGIGPMQVSRRIHVLEEELGVRLLHRTTRAVSLTAEGERFLPYARSMIDAEDSARAALLPASATASGVLKLTAPSVFGQAIVMPLLPALLAQHPQLRIDLDLSDRVLDIVGEGFDLALRVATLGDSELVAKRLAGNPRMLCASPQYLARHGVPATLADLATHACITLHAVPRWPVVVDGILQRVSVAPRITTSNVDAARAAALQGLGLAMLTYWDVYRQLRDGDLLSIVLADAAMEDLSVWAVTPTRRFVPARVTIFLDALSRELARLK